MNVKNYGLNEFVMKIYYCENYVEQWDKKLWHCCRRA